MTFWRSKHDKLWLINKTRKNTFVKLKIQDGKNRNCDDNSKIIKKNIESKQLQYLNLKKSNKLKKENLVECFFLNVS